ncbi:MAG: hypothetical protein LQ350_004511, partial [Teloschistes chrysophthalmus]
MAIAPLSPVTIGKVHDPYERLDAPPTGAFAEAAGAGAPPPGAAADPLPGEAGAADPLPGEAGAAAGALPDGGFEATGAAGAAGALGALAAGGLPGDDAGAVGAAFAVAGADEAEPTGACGTGVVNVATIGVSAQ